MSVRVIHLAEQDWQASLRLVRERAMFAGNAADWEPLLEALELDRPARIDWPPEGHELLDGPARAEAEPLASRRAPTGAAVRRISPHAYVVADEQI